MPEIKIVRLLLGMGFGGSVSSAGRTLGRSGDGGVDGVIHQDVLGLERVYFQAKRYALGNNVGSGRSETFLGALIVIRQEKGCLLQLRHFRLLRLKQRNFSANASCW